MNLILVRHHFPHNRCSYHTAIPVAATAPGIGTGHRLSYSLAASPRQEKISIILLWSRL
jgi:hypothetical protein